MEEINKIHNNRRIVSIAKDDLANLPAASFDGNIILVDSEQAAADAVRELMNEEIIGFDTETKPSFKRGQSNKVALLQLSTHNTCYLFRLNHIGVTEPVKRLLEDENILKIGLSIHDDFHNLRKICDLNPGGFIDLQQYVKDYMIADNSLSRIFAILFDLRISKGQRLSNWEAEELTPHQQGYAALDAFACIKIYEYLKEGNFNPLSSAYLKELEEDTPIQ